jgi:hypothetical protein
MRIIWELYPGEILRRIQSDTAGMKTAIILGTGPPKRAGVALEQVNAKRSWRPL